jgi:hypothetical protein
MAGRRVNDHTGRLVDHRDIGIFVHDCEGNILRHQIGWPSHRKPDVYAIAGVYWRAWARVVAIQADVCVLNQLACIAARKIGHSFSYISIESQPIVRLLDHEL